LITSYLATKGDLEKLLLEWRHEYGQFVEFQTPGNPPILVVSDPDAIRQVRGRARLSGDGAGGSGQLLGLIQYAGFVEDEALRIW